MTGDPMHRSPRPVDTIESLREALAEHGTPPAEVDELAASLVRLTAWRAPTPASIETSRLLASLYVHLPDTTHGMPARRSWHAWVAQHARLIARQPRLIHRSVWIASTLAIALVGLYAAALHGPNGARALGVCLPTVAAAGAAFLYGHEADPALEVSLAAPASSRFILLARVVLLVGYDLALALGATALVAATHGQGWEAIAGLWLGPLALVSSGSLLVSLLLGPFIAAGGAAMLWLAQTLNLTASGGVQLALDPLWQTTPLTFLLAVVLLALALLYLPRRERLA